jgi:hypothetical protein
MRDAIVWWLSHWNLFALECIFGIVAVLSGICAGAHE